MYKAEKIKAILRFSEIKIPTTLRKYTIEIWDRPLKTGKF